MELDSKKYPLTAKGFKYALDVLDGTIVSNIHLKGACQRFVDDIKKTHLYVFDPEKSERFLRIGQKFKHVKGHWKIPTMVFEPWQCFIFVNIFGFYLAGTKIRRFRTAHVEISRGNGKSPLAAIVGLYFLALDNPLGNEIYSAATGKDQARIVLDSARAMAKANKDFLKVTGTKVLAHQIVHEKSNSFFKALSSDSDTLDGLQPAAAIIDELHAHKNRLVYDVIDSAMSKRNDSLLFVITTAGFDTSGIGHSQSSYAKKICSQEVDDDSFFAVVYSADDGDDITKMETWLKANPNWAVSVDPRNFEAKAKKSLENVEDQNNFMVKHLNIWTSASAPYFSIPKYKLGDREIVMESFKGASCSTAIDLASKDDLVSFAYIFKEGDKFYQFNKNFIPEGTLKASKNNAYKRWAEKGYMIPTTGEAINYIKLQDVFLNDSKDYKFLVAHYDPWNATEFGQRMAAERINMVEFRMNTANFSEPMKMLRAMYNSEKLYHPKDELFEWSLGCVVAKLDANDNVFPRKTHPHLKIDPVVATIMAFAHYISDLKAPSSVYETRGIIVL